MITFANPKKYKMASGSDCLQLTEAGTWESFPPFAEKYVRQIGASVLNKIETPDMHLWEVEYYGATLNLVYEDFPNGVSIEPKDNRGQSAIDILYSLAMEQKSQNGL